MILDGTDASTIADWLFLVSELTDAGPGAYLDTVDHLQSLLATSPGDNQGHPATGEFHAGLQICSAFALPVIPDGPARTITVSGNFLVVAA